MKIHRIYRNESGVVVLYTEDDTIQKKKFPAKMTNDEIRCSLLGIEYKPEPVPEVPKKTDEPKKTVAPKKLHEEISDKRTAKAQMLKVLKEHGVDTTGLLTFTAVEEVYNKHFKDGGK